MDTPPPGGHLILDCIFQCIELSFMALVPSIFFATAKAVRKPCDNPCDMLKQARIVSGLDCSVSAEVQGFQPHAHSTGFGVGVNNFRSEFAAQARQFNATKGHRCVENVVRVDPDGAGIDLVGQ